MSSYHQTFFLPAGKSWEINFVPRVKTHPRSANLRNHLHKHHRESQRRSQQPFLYLINTPAFSGSAISASGDLNRISQRTK